MYLRKILFVSFLAIFACAQSAFAEAGPGGSAELVTAQTEQQNSSDSLSQSSPALAACYAPDTDPKLIERVDTLLYGKDPEPFTLTARWSATATDGGGLGQGDPTVLTYSFIPDGTSIPSAGGIGEPTSNSDMFAFLDGLHGSTPAWQARVHEVFDRWEELTGITYVFQPTDDGASFPGSPGVLGVRGDIRIGGHFIDGPSSILAYNYFPDTGDMVIDTSDPLFFNTTNDALLFRNIFSHENGHGIGLRHVCPINQTKLMEPFITSAFDGPQHDEIQGAQRHYGDSAEDNNSTGAAADLGLLVGSLELGDVSLDNVTEQDFYAVTMNNPGTISVALTPVGTSYLEGIQNGDGSCTPGDIYDSLSVLNLGVQLFDTDGTTLLDSANANPAGQGESIIDVIINGSGTYFVRVFATSADSDPKEDVQLYSLELIQGESVGQPPNLSALADDSMDEGTTTSVALLAVDGDGDNITLSVLGLPSFGTLIDNFDGTGALEFAPGFNDNGIYPISVTATDDSAFELSDTEGFVLTVDDANGPPTIDLILDDQVNFDDTVIIPISSTDPDGDNLTLSTIGLPGFAMLTDNGDGTGFIEATPSAANAGIHEIGVVVTDDGIGMLDDATTFLLAVGNFNLAPQIMPFIDQSMDATDVLIVPVTAIDPNDSDVVTLGSIGLPAFAQLNDNGDGTGSIVFSPTLDDVSDIPHPIIITATDDDAAPLTDTESFLLTVECVVPDMASAPAPFNSESGVRPKGVDLTWTAFDEGTEDCPETYTVLFGTDAGAMTPLCEDIDTTSCATGPLEPMTTYFWKVITFNCCDQNGGPIWQFTTSNIPEILDINTDAYPTIVVTATADTANGPSCSLGADDFSITEGAVNQGILDFDCNGDGIYTMSYETTNPAENGSVREVCLTVDDGGLFTDCENYIAPVGPCDFLVIGGVNRNQFPQNTVLASVFTDIGRTCGLADEAFMVFEDGVMQEISDVSCVATDGAVVDVAFVFDKSGSMDTEIAAMQAQATNFANALLASQANAQFGLVAFSDTAEFRLQLTPNVASFQNAIDSLVAEGGEDPAEVSLDATMMAVNQMNWREVSQKVIILVTDARAHFRGDGSTLSSFIMPEVVTAVNDIGARVFAVSPDFSSPVLALNDNDGNAIEAVEAADDLETDVRVLAEETGGLFIDINSANLEVIANQIIIVITSTYAITYFTTNPAMDGTTREVCVKVEDPDEGFCINCITYVAPVPNIGPPVIEPIDDQMMFEGDFLSVSVSATDPDNDDITLSPLGLPLFGTFTDNGNGTGFFEFNPGQQTEGDYLISVKAIDDGFPHLFDIESFVLTVECVPLNPAIDPSPADGAEDVDTSVTLSWVGGGKSTPFSLAPESDALIEEILARSVATAALYPRSPSSGEPASSVEGIEPVMWDHASFVSGIDAASSESVLYYTGNGARVWPMTAFVSAMASVNKPVTITDIFPADLSAFCVVYLGVSALPYSESQKLALTNYVSGGGRLVIVGEWDGFEPTSFDVLNEVAAVVGSTMSLVPEFDCDTCEVAPIFGSDPVTEGVGSLGYGCTSRVNIGSGRTLLRSNDTNDPIIGIEDVGLGSVVMLADSNMVIDDCLAEGNLKFFQNLCLDVVPDDCNTRYDVLFGTNPDNLTLLYEDLETTSCNPGELEPLTTYYWQVISKDCCSDVPGPIWSFTTKCGFVEITDIDSEDFSEITLQVSVATTAGLACELTEEDFMITEDGVMQEITDFSCDEVVVDVVVVFDITTSMGSLVSSLQAEAAAFAQDFVAGNVSPQFGLIVVGRGFGGQPEIDLPLTSDISAFQAAVNSISLTGGTEPMLDGVMLGLDNMAWRTNSDKVFVVITDGFSNGDNTDLQSTINAVNAQNGTVYSVSPPATDLFPPFPTDYDVQELAVQTGGIAVDLDIFSNVVTVDFTEISDLILGNLAAGYTITYVTTNDVQDSTIREVCVKVTDPNLGECFDCEFYTAPDPNIPPILTPIADEMVDEGEQVIVNIISNDPDGDNLTLSVTDLPIFGDFVDNGDGTGSIDFTPNFLQSGVYPMIVTVTDDGNPNLSDTDTFTLTVKNINRPPLVMPITNVTMRVNESLDVGVTAMDFDNDGLTLTDSATPGFGSFTDHGDGTGTFSFMPDSDDGGFYPMGVTALDDGDPNLFGVNHFILTVQAPPVLAPIADAEMIEEEMLDIPLLAIDPNGDPLILNTVGLPSFGELVDNGDGSGSLLFAPAIGDSGIFEISVTALVPGDPLQTDTKMFILTVNGVSGEPANDLDLSTWIDQPFNNDPAFGGSTFRNSLLGLSGGQGLCMNVGLTGMNGQQWKSPNNIIGLTARTVYRVRTFIATDQTVQGRVPVWDINYINTQPSGFLNYGGRRWFIDSEGGANAIGIGRDSFDIYIAPSAVDTPQWNGDGALATSSHAFTAEASANTGFRFVYRVLDFDEGLQASERSGTICIEQIIVEAIPLELLNRDVTVLYNTPISTFTHRAYRPSTIIDPLSVAVFDNNSNTLTYRLPSAAAASVDPVVATLGTDINILPVMVLDPIEGVGLVRTAQKFYPVAWETDTLYRGRVAISATDSEFNPIDVLDFTHDAYTAELGGSDWTTSGDRNIGRAGMGGAGSPKLPSTTNPVIGSRVPEWHTYFYGNNATASMISEAKRFRVQLDLFNRSDIGIQSPNTQSGSDALRIHSLEIDRIELDVE